MFRLGFLGDFLSASVLIGFLTGVGVQVFTGQIPGHARHPEGHRRLVQAAVAPITTLDDINWPTLAFAAGTLVIILGFKRFLPQGARGDRRGHLLIAVSAIDAAQSTAWPSSGRSGRLPADRAAKGIDLTSAECSAIAFSCFILIIAQSAATSRSFAMKHGQSVDINRDIVGLSGANFAAGLSGTFVVNGSPTKTQILDEQKGRTQLANLTMSGSCCSSCCSSPRVLTDMPKSVLARSCSSSAST